MATAVRTAADLDNVRNNLSGDYIQTANIDLSGLDWQRIGDALSPFTGNYNGNHYTINNLTINQPLGVGWGLFGELLNARVEKINLLNANVTVAWSSGVLVGGAEAATVERCFVQGDIEDTSGDETGGFIGISYSSFFTDCAARVNVTGTGNQTAGFIGSAYNSNVFTNCYSAGAVVVPGWSWSSGGFCGYTDVEGLFNSCYYDEELSGMSDGGKGEPRSTAEMTHPEDFGTTYQGWDFTNIWLSDTTYTINDGYPYFAAAGFDMWVKKSNVWEPVNDLYVKKGGAWQAVQGVWTKKGGSWQPV